jgi:hypothetical protein
VVDAIVRACGDQGRDDLLVGEGGEGSGRRHRGRALNQPAKPFELQRVQVRCGSAADGEFVPSRPHHDRFHGRASVGKWYGKAGSAGVGADRPPNVRARVVPTTRGLSGTTTTRTDMSLIFDDGHRRGDRGLGVVSDQCLQP